MKVNVIVFPGSNCDHDVIHLFQKVLKQNVETVWHRDRELKQPDLVVLPGGFSYGDYLRAGALARLSPIIEPVKKFAEAGGLVLGICNGFQILCEVGMLPGVLLKNRSMKFISRFLHFRVERQSSIFSSIYGPGQVLCAPVAHFEGNYFAEADDYRALEDNGQVLFRYCSADGTVDADSALWNPNGSIGAIAGITNKSGNILGMMPHPERASESIVGRHAGDHGVGIFRSVVQHLEKSGTASGLTS